MDLTLESERIWLFKLSGYNVFFSFFFAFDFMKILLSFEKWNFLDEIRVMFRVLLTSMNSILLFNSSLNQPITYGVCMLLVTTFMVLYIRDAQIPSVNELDFEMLNRTSDDGESLPATEIENVSDFDCQDLEPTDD